MNVLQPLLVHNRNCTWCLCLDVDGVFGQMLLRPLGTTKFTFTQSQKLHQIGKVLHGLSKKGAAIVLNTGRGLVETNLLAQEMNLAPSEIDFICEHGTVARISNQEVNLLPHHLTKPADFLSHPLVHHLKSILFPKYEILEKHFMCTIQLPESIIGNNLKITRFYNQVLIAVEKTPHYQKSKQSFKILLGPESIDFILLDWNKAKALAKYRRLTGLSAEKTLSVGDTLNDQGMMEISGFAAAPSNGSVLSDYFTNHRKAGTYFLATRPVALGTLQILDWFNTDILF